MSEINYRRNGKKYSRDSRFTRRLELPRKWQRNRKTKFNRRARRIMNRNIGFTISINIVDDPRLDTRW